MCTGITVLHGFPGRKVPGGGFQLSIKLCIIVHAFLTIWYPFSLISSMMCNICTKSNKPLKPLDLRGFEDGSREVIWTPDQRLMSPLLYHWATLPLSGWCRKAEKYLTRIGKNVQIFLWIRSILSRQPAFPSREIITDEAFFTQPFHTACVPCRFLHAGIYGTGHYDAFCPMPLPQQDRK